MLSNKAVAKRPKDTDIYLLYAVKLQIELKINPKSRHVKPFSLNEAKKNSLFDIDYFLYRVQFTSVILTYMQLFSKFLSPNKAVLIVATDFFHIQSRFGFHLNLSFTLCYHER